VSRVANVDGSRQSGMISHREDVDVVYWNVQSGCDQITKDAVMTPTAAAAAAAATG